MACKTEIRFALAPRRREKHWSKEAPGQNVGIMREASHDAHMSLTGLDSSRTQLTLTKMWRPLRRVSAVQLATSNVASRALETCTGHHKDARTFRQPLRLAWRMSCPFVHVSSEWGRDLRKGCSPWVRQPCVSAELRHNRVLFQVPVSFNGVHDRDLLSPGGAPARKHRYKDAPGHHVGMMKEASHDGHMSLAGP